MSQLHVCCLAVLGASLSCMSAELSVPAFTAYLEPAPEGAQVSEHAGITGWSDPAIKVVWFGELKNPGRLDCALALRPSSGATNRLRLTVAGQAREAMVMGSETNQLLLPLGSFEIAKPGYQRFTLESLNPPGQPVGKFEALLLDGPAAKNAHFNLKPRRNAASVHLVYPTPKGTNIEAFYCEVTALEDPLWTFYMACGWQRGYFGMQINSPTERRIIFSVWDSGHEPSDRGQVADENRVKLVAKGDGVFSGEFGNEGTGGHSHWVYPWKTGEKQRFLVTANPTDATHTVYSGYYFESERKQWILISSWKAPKDGGCLRGLHSFSENFGGDNGQLRRKALYGNQWARLGGGQWLELTNASFSHDPTGRTDRLDRFMGVENGQFFLSHGGFVPGSTDFGEKFTRSATGVPPTDFVVPQTASPVAPSSGS